MRAVKSYIKSGASFPRDQAKQLNLRDVKAMFDEMAKVSGPLFNLDKLTVSPKVFRALHQTLPEWEHEKMGVTFRKMMGGVELPEDLAEATRLVLFGSTEPRPDVQVVVDRHMPDDRALAVPRRAPGEDYAVWVSRWRVVVFEQSDAEQGQLLVCACGCSLGRHCSTGCLNPNCPAPSKCPRPL